MALLGLVWLVLLILEFTRGLGPFLDSLTIAIWIVFLLNFALELTIAPDKLAYLRRNWLSAISLALPALRAFRALRFVRVLRAARITRGLRLFRLLSSVNRGLGALGSHMSRRGIGYVVALTVLVTVLGSAGIYAFESHLPGGSGLDSFGAALWWTAMLMTTMGSEYWPRTGEGRVLCFLLSLYAFTVFGYVTASLASFFIGRDNQARASHEPSDRDGELQRLSREIALLRAELQGMSAGMNR